MKKLLAMVLCLAMSLAIVGCGGGEGGGEDTPSAPESKAPAPSVAATTGSLSVEIVSAKLAKDMNGKDAALVTYKFTNNTSKKQNFKFAVNCTVKQGEATLEAATVPETEGYDATLPAKNLETGEATEVHLGYLLNDTTTALDVTCKLLSGEDKSEVTGTVELK